MSWQWTIRPEESGDADAIREVNELAFGRSDEAVIVDRLRKEEPTLLSLVAAEDDLVVGHILFSPVVAEGPRGPIQGMGLAPMAVHPLRQRQGIGSELVRRGLDYLREGGCPFVIVLGHPGFYPRFGFEPASCYGLECQWEGVPDEAFMAVPLDESALERIRGLVRYHEIFAEEG